MRVEQDQRVTEDARRFAEQDAAAQRYAVQVLQVLIMIKLLFCCVTFISKYLLAAISPWFLSFTECQYSFLWFENYRSFLITL